MLRLSLLAITLGISQVSCGAAAELTCGSGDKIVFGYQAVPTALGARSDMVTVENGTRYLFVDESCRYWVLPGKEMWEFAHQGTLTDEQLARLNRDIMTRDWNAMHDAKAVPATGPSDGAPQYIWRDETVAYCAAGCPEIVSSAISATQSLMNDLWDSGALMDSDAPLRWRMRADSVTIPIAPTFVWKGTTALAALADVNSLAACGDAPVVSGPDADLVRGDLTTLIRDYAGQPFPLLYTDGDVRYNVYARDALPFEDERGLVRPPGIDWGVE